MITMGKIPLQHMHKLGGNVPVTSLQYTLRLAAGTKVSVSGNVPVASLQYKERDTAHAHNDGNVPVASH